MAEVFYNEKYFRRYLHYLAQDLDNVPLFAKIREWVTEEKPKRILDVGCGIGYLIHWLCQKTEAKGWGVDFSRAALDQAKTLYPKVKFLQQEVTKLDFKEKFFDCLLMINVIEHLDEKKQKKALAEGWRILKDNGFLILSTPNKDSPYTRIWINDPTHQKELTKRELFQLVKKNFLIEEMIYTNSIGRFGRRVNYFLSAIFPADFLLKLRKRKF